MQDLKLIINNHTLYSDEGKTKGDIIQIGILKDGIMTGWHFRNCKIGNDYSDPDNPKFGGYTLTELEEIYNNHLINGNETLDGVL